MCSQNPWGGPLRCSCSVGPQEGAPGGHWCYLDILLRLIQLKYLINIQSKWKYPISELSTYKALGKRSESGTWYWVHDSVDCNKCSGFTSGIYKPPTVDSFILNSFTSGEQCWSYSQTLRICTRADANRIDTHTDLHKDTLSLGLPWWQDALEEGNPPQYPCLKNPKDSGAWQAIAYRVTQSWTRLKQLSMHAPSHGICCDASGIHQISLKQHAALGPI